MPTDDERREVARRLRDYPAELVAATNSTDNACKYYILDLLECVGLGAQNVTSLFERLADLIEPSYKPDAEYETWYNGLSHFGDERGGPSTIHELIEEIVWAALTVDLGPNGNTDSTGVDEGRVYTDRLFAEWEREALRLSGGIDRDALLRLSDEIYDTSCDNHGELTVDLIDIWGWAQAISESLGVES